MFTFVLISAILIIFVNPYHVNYEEREAILLSQNAKQENIDIQILKEDRKDWFSHFSAWTRKTAEFPLCPVYLCEEVSTVAKN